MNDGVKLTVGRPDINKAIIPSTQISDSTSAGRALLTGASIQAQRQTLSIFATYDSYEDLVANGPSQVQRGYITADYYKIYAYIPSLTQYKEIAGTDNYPAFSVTNLNDPSGPINAGNTITYNTTICNRGNTINIANGMFTAPLNGIYNVTFNGITDATVSPPHEVLLMKNNVYANIRAFSAFNGYLSIGFTTLIQLAANDTLKLYINAGGIHNNAGSVFSVNLLG